MADRPQSSPGVSHRTLFSTAIACLIVGFIGGVALTAYKTSGLSGVGNPDPHSGMGNAAPSPAQGDLDAMEAALRRRTDENPADPAAWAQLGHLYFDAGRFDAAIDAYREALNRDPENGDLWTDLGVMHRRAGNSRKAMEAFDRAIELNPRHEIARFNRGIVLLHDLDRPEEGLRAWEELARINPVFSTGDGRTLDELMDRYKADADSGNSN